MKTIEFLPCLTITNDQFSLTTTNWHKRINGFNAGLHWFPYRDTWNDTRSFNTNTETLFGFYWTLAINGITCNSNILYNTLLQISK